MQISKPIRALDIWSAGCALALASGVLLSTAAIPALAESACPAKQGTETLYTEDLPEITSVEVFALSGNPSDGAAADARFPIRPYDESSAVVASKEISGASAQAVAKLWRKLKPGAVHTACHLPVYGLRFYREAKNEMGSEKQLLFETSICWKCANFSVPQIYPGGSFTWFYFDAASKDAVALKELLQSTVPNPNAKTIDAAEID